MINLRSAGAGAILGLAIMPLTWYTIARIERSISDPIDLTVYDMSDYCALSKGERRYLSREIRLHGTGGPELHGTSEIAQAKGPYFVIYCFGDTVNDWSYLQVEDF